MFRPPHEVCARRLSSRSSMELDEELNLQSSQEDIDVGEDHSGMMWWMVWRVRIKPLSCWFSIKRRVLKTMEGSLPLRLMLVLQAAASAVWSTKFRRWSHIRTQSEVLFTQSTFTLATCSLDDPHAVNFPPCSTLVQVFLCLLIDCGNSD